MCICTLSQLKFQLWKWLYTWYSWNRSCNKTVNNRAILHPVVCLIIAILILMDLGCCIRPLTHPIPHHWFFQSNTYSKFEESNIAASECSHKFDINCVPLTGVWYTLTGSRPQDLISADSWVSTIVHNILANLAVVLRIVSSYCTTWAVWIAYWYS